MAFQLKSIFETTAFQFIDELLGQYHSDDGFAKTNRFELIITPPTGYRGQNQSGNIFAPIMQQNTGEGVTQKVGVMCETFSFPGRNLDTAPDENIYGPTREIVQGYSYADVTAVFQCSSDMKEKRFFETWQRLAYNPQTWAMQYYNDYSGSIQLFQLDETDRQRYGVELVECFPKTIEAQAVDYSTVNAIQTVSVTFSYRYWKDLIDEADLPRPLGDRIADSVLNTVESKITSMIPKVLRKL